MEDSKDVPGSFRIPKSKKHVAEDPVDKERREKVKEAMIHAWSSYEKYAWGQDELQVHKFSLLLRGTLDRYLDSGC